MAKENTDQSAEPSASPIVSEADTSSADTSTETAPSPPQGDAMAMPMPEVTREDDDSPPEDSQQTLDMNVLGDVELDVKIELGRCQMLVGDVLRLAPGNVVELDKLAGDPVDVYVNERLIAHGEVLVVNENFCVRVNEIVTPAS